jgi:spore coat-associated protein N
MRLSASLPRKIAASVALLAAVAGIAAAGTSAALRHSASRPVSAGTFDLQLNGSDTNQTIGEITTAAPGDSITRTVSVENKGTLAFADVLLTTEASSSNALTAARSGLQMVVDKCSVAWTGTDAAATCGGTVIPIIASTDVVGSNRSLSLALRPSATAHLRIKLTLPSGYDDNTGVSNATRFTFDALQRTTAAQ